MMCYYTMGLVWTSRDFEQERYERYARAQQMQGKKVSSSFCPVVNCMQ